MPGFPGRLIFTLYSYQPIFQPLPTPVNSATNRAAHRLTADLYQASVVKLNADHISTHTGATATLKSNSGLDKIHNVLPIRTFVLFHYNTFDAVG